MGAAKLARRLGLAVFTTSFQWLLTTPADAPIFAAGGVREGSGTGPTCRAASPVLAMSLSIPTYAIFTRLCGSAAQAWHLAALRFIASLVYMYLANDAYGAKLLTSVFIAGGVTAAFYGWFPLYLPELFATSIRATSQGFAYNFGRVLSAVGSLQTAVLTAYFAQGIAADRVEVEAFPRAGATLAGIYLVGVAIIWLGPETKGKPLPD